MRKNAAKNGASISAIDANGFILNLDGKEYRLDFSVYPWFEYCSIREMLNVRSDAYGVYWEEAGIELERKSLEKPEEYPLKMALDKLSDEKIVELDDERKAQMVSNLLVVLCGNKDAQPIVNSGSIS